MVRCTAVPDTRCELIQSSFMVSRRHPGADTLPCYPKGGNPTA